MNEVWVVLYASGYTSEAYTKIYKDKAIAYNRFYGMIESYYNNDEFTIDEVFKAIEDGDVLEGENVTYEDLDLTWDGSEVYERISMYKQEVL